MALNVMPLFFQVLTELPEDEAWKCEADCTPLASWDGGMEGWPAKCAMRNLRYQSRIRGGEDSSPDSLESHEAIRHEDVACG